ncbi:MAG TPA: DUF1549 and DUF1553 domain-containing protein [Planctomycetaceae bacterium]|jgi:hypothetical protein|nr:DUF1549 and DUF1553 domain-containing protein [Planctomycetaceae bacterium]
MIRPYSTSGEMFIAARRGLFVGVLFSLVLVGSSKPASSATANSGASLAILPHKIVLRGPKARQAIVVEREEEGRLVGQASEGLVFESSNSKIVRVSNSVAIPVGDGKATIRARWKGRTAQIDVTVENQKVDEPWSFRNHVQAVLTKAGCNSGACHGATAGKNGFKLSLRGYDPPADFLAITRQAGGRRIVPSDPGRSLVLLKPSGAIPHKGGLRFKVDSHEYRVLAEWIAAGQPAPAADDPRIERLEIVPEDVVLKKGDQQQVLILAHFNDGHTEDVTSWAKFTSTNLTVCQVDDVGKVKVTGNGEGSISAWYLSKTVLGTVQVPYESPLPANTFAKADRRNSIDDLVLAKLERLNIPPSPICSDADYLRRASLDTIGLLPTVAEARAFLADRRPDKRVRLADQLLTRPEFVDYWSAKWSDLLLVSAARLRPSAVQTFSKWIRKRVAENEPWDRFVREIVTSRGSTIENGAANFYAMHEDPQEMAETVSMAFLGMSIQCAHCHDHPLEKWTNDDYYGMANLFARVRGKDGNDSRIIFVADSGELIQPRTGRPQLPRPLDAAALSFDSTADRRDTLADWLTHPQNPYFSRSIVNRVWANFMGRGLVEAVDDMRLTNPPSNGPLLTALADNLSKGGYDLKALMRMILTAATYQRASATLAGNEGDERFYSRFYPRRLKAEVLLDALSQVTGTPTTFKGHPSGTRALELADSQADSYFLGVFGRPERLITCECERSNEPSMSQVLHLTNGDTLNAKIEASGNRIDHLMAADDRRVVEDLYLAALSRFPNPAERQKISAALGHVEESDRQPALNALRQKIAAAQKAQDPAARQKMLASVESRIREIPTETVRQRRKAIEDLYWSVLSSNEFLFNH